MKVFLGGSICIYGIYIYLVSFPGYPARDFLPTFGPNVPSQQFQTDAYLPHKFTKPLKFYCFNMTQDQTFKVAFINSFDVTWPFSIYIQLSSLMISKFPFILSLWERYNFHTKKSKCDWHCTSFQCSQSNCYKYI